jgi:uncharacterized membrane protein
METKKTQKDIHLFFEASILIKGAIALVEIVAGFTILFIPPSVVTNIVFALTQTDLANDPNDFIATTLLTAAQQFAVGGAAFLVFYLLSRGIIKIFIVAALLKNKLWAYPAMLTVTGIFILSQIYQIIKDHSILMIVLTVIDLIVVYFVWREYKIVLEKRRAQKA